MPPRGTTRRCSRTPVARGASRGTTGMTAALIAVDDRGVGEAAPAAGTPLVTENSCRRERVGGRERGRVVRPSWMRPPIRSRHSGRIAGRALGEPIGVYRLERSARDRQRQIALARQVSRFGAAGRKGRCLAPQLCPAFSSLSGLRVGRVVSHRGAPGASAPPPRSTGSRVSDLVLAACEWPASAGLPSPPARRRQVDAGNQCRDHGWCLSWRQARSKSSAARRRARSV